MENKERETDQLFENEMMLKERERKEFFHLKDKAIFENVMDSFYQFCELIEEMTDGKSIIQAYDEVVLKMKHLYNDSVYKEDDLSIIIFHLDLRLFRMSSVLEIRNK